MSMSMSVWTAVEKSLFLAKSPLSPNPHSDHRRVIALDLDSQAAFQVFGTLSPCYGRVFCGFRSVVRSVGRSVLVKTADT